MPDVITASPSPAAVAHPPAISVREIWPWALFGLVLLLLAYVVGVGQGISALTSESALHEWLHDGRHLLGFPCH
jgi:hypothetical protein